MKWKLQLLLIINSKTNEIQYHRVVGTHTFTATTLHYAKAKAMQIAKKNPHLTPHIQNRPLWRHIGTPETTIATRHYWNSDAYFQYIVMLHLRKETPS